MRILLLGADGQVGWELRRALAPLGELVAAGRACAAAGPCGDLDRPEELAASVRRLQPDAIVVAAAFTDVDRAEREPALAERVNAHAPALLAREAAALGAWLVHYSTDYVFDGSGDDARDEDAPTGPLNAYGRSKLEGEQRIRASGCRHLILRTSWVHAPRRRNFVLSILRAAAQRERLEVPADQVGAPTGADLVADVTAPARRAARAAPALSGTYHVAAAGHTSRLGCARFVVERALALGHRLRAAPDTVEAAPADPPGAPRPRNSRLATAKLRAAFGLEMPPWQHGVERTLAEAPGASAPPPATDGQA